MRLLNVRTLELGEFSGLRIPNYAILSHRWEDEEVLFGHIGDPASFHRKGWVKIKYACKEAHENDGLDWLWVDTCCIDKSSSSELSEAINSMFEWYAKAHVCYAYLSDVREDVPGPLLDIPGFSPDLVFQEAEFLESAFGRSQWFTRGWTLQELIAPSELRFYGQSWNYLGSNRTLTRSINVVTGIDPDIISSGFQFNRYRLQEICVAKKMSWAAKRITTRVEDQAYCLLGIFDVNMAMIYGEGEKAFTRLQEEIIKTVDDQTILCWDDSNEMNGALLATSPGQFRNGNRIRRWKQDDHTRPFSMTNKGLDIEVRILRRFGQGNDVAILECSYEDDFKGPLGITLIEGEQRNAFKIANNRLCVVDMAGIHNVSTKSIFIEKAPSLNQSSLSLVNQPASIISKPWKFWIRIQKPGLDHHRLEVVGGSPSACWNRDTNVLWLPQGHLPKASVIIRTESQRISIVFGTILRIDSVSAYSNVIDFNYTGENRSSYLRYKMVQPWVIAYDKDLWRSWVEHPTSKNFILPTSEQQMPLGNHEILVKIIEETFLGEKIYAVDVLYRRRSA
jgi:Heterokaryon incompatibility protein (HET)